MEIDQLEPEVLGQERPVLLACLRRSPESREQESTLSRLEDAFGANLMVRMLDRTTAEAFAEKHRIFGTPTFIVFVRGDEQDRLLGTADADTLHAFVRQALCSVQAEA